MHSAPDPAPTLSEKPTPISGTPEEGLFIFGTSLEEEKTNRVKKDVDGPHSSRSKRAVLRREPVMKTLPDRNNSTGPSLSLLVSTPRTSRAADLLCRNLGLTAQVEILPLSQYYVRRRHPADLSCWPGALLLQGSSEAPLVNPIPGATTLHHSEGAVTHLGCRLSGYRLRDRYLVGHHALTYPETPRSPKRHLAL